MMPREHIFRSEICWDLHGDKKNIMDFFYHFQGKAVIDASPASYFKGNEKRISPEELFVSSISSCQMLTYLHLCSKNGIEVLSYRDEAKGFLSMIPGDKIFMKRIELFPVITLENVDDNISKAMAVRLIHEAHDTCFLTNSIITEIIIEPNFIYMIE